MTLLFFLCLTSTTVIRMLDPIKYGSSVLLGIRDTVTDNHSLRILDPYVCVVIRSLNLTKRIKRRNCGKRAGNHVRFPRNHTELTGTPNSDDGIETKFILLNARSIRSKEHLIRDEIDSMNAGFAVVTETWLQDKFASWVECSQFNQDGYKIQTHDRKGRTGGGIALVYKQNLTVAMKEKGQLRSFEYLITSIRIRGTVICLVIIYHAPYSKASRITTSNFVTDFANFLPDIIVKYNNILILGDSNLHLDDSEDMDAMLFKDIMHAMGLISYVNFPAHVAGHTLDQVYTVLGSRITVRKCTQGPLISDHYTVKGCVVVPYISTTTRYIQSRKLKAIDINSFIEDINTGNIPLQNTNEAVAAFDTELLRVLNKHAPVKTIKISDRKKEVWYDDHIKLQKKFVRNREHVWNKYNREHDHYWKAFTVERNRLNRMIAGTKIRENSTRIEQCGHDTRKLYNLVNNITGRTKTNPMPPGKTDQLLADEFADYFLTKIKKIRDDLAECVAYSPTHADIEPLNQFKPLSVDNVVKIIRSMPSKSCESDVLPTKLLKQCLAKIGNTITAIVNISLRDGVFAESWKEAIVRPLLKKSGLELAARNYRPVSNLPFLSKVVEKCMLVHFSSHCEKNHLLPE